ncbi:phosphatidylinositol 4-kinase alpha 1 [Prunus yedoensis var. nudiflora]|uniref:Phosphatidylinositol 4-kinase alpha 1 n=1 Tax=Prunus yedoensis var. nudiflora TaxID=2094558 RepID=A0A314UKY6_PRUYE|nr:phosphatidylinositol 4-kinase alpha 1 [Prunus yedoensis var. nudiflora]
MLRQQVSSFEEESVENLEKQEIAFKLVAHILDKVRIDSALLEQVRFIAKRQLQSMSVFLKIRKRDWNEHGALLKARINTKLSVYQAAAKLTLSCLACYETDVKSAKNQAWWPGTAYFAHPLKPVVLTVCSQADTWATSQGAMFESVMKTSCEIIESCWTKERAPVDTFIMGLATSIRERNDFEEQADKDKEAVPVVQLMLYAC